MYFSCYHLHRPLNTAGLCFDHVIQFVYTNAVPKTLPYIQLLGLWAGKWVGGWKGTNVLHHRIYKLYICMHYCWEREIEGTPGDSVRDRKAVVPVGIEKGHMLDTDCLYYF
jgi:hypothetical protein